MHTNRIEKMGYLKMNPQHNSMGLMPYMHTFLNNENTENFHKQLHSVATCDRGTWYDLRRVHHKLGKPATSRAYACVNAREVCGDHESLVYTSHLEYIFMFMHP